MNPRGVRAHDQVARLAVLLCLLVAVGVDAARYFVQALLGMRKRIWRLVKLLLTRATQYVVVMVLTASAMAA